MLALTCLYGETKRPEYLPVTESRLSRVWNEMPRTEYGGLPESAAEAWYPFFDVYSLPAGSEG